MLWRTPRQWVISWRGAASARLVWVLPETLRRAISNCSTWSWASRMGLSIAVVTPSLNQGRFIERTIRSVLDQGYSPLEYVVCDGGSTDETPDVLARFGDRLTAVIEPDAGQAAAVNKGIRMTSSE